MLRRLTGGTVLLALVVSCDASDKRASTARSASAEPSPRIELAQNVPSSTELSPGEVAAARAEAQVVRTMVETLPVTLAELEETADRIFLGTVERVEVKSEQLPGLNGSTNVQHVTFKVERVVKGASETLREGKPYTVRMLADYSRRIAVGERLAWFLAPDSKELGVTQPVGVQSGDFRVFEAKDKGLVAVNQKGNKNLMSVDAVKEQASELKQFVPESKREEFATQVKKWVTASSKAPNQPVPLDLLLTRTELLASREQRQIDGAIRPAGTTREFEPGGGGGGGARNAARQE